jgi:hypothetical protein
MAIPAMAPMETVVVTVPSPGGLDPNGDPSGEPLPEVAVADPPPDPVTVLDPPTVVCGATPLRVAVGKPPNGVTDVPPIWEAIVARRLTGMPAPETSQMPAAPLEGRTPIYPFGQQKKSRLPTCSIWNMFHVLLAHTATFLTAAPQSLSTFPQSVSQGLTACRMIERKMASCGKTYRLGSSTAAESRSRSGRSGSSWGCTMG